MDCKKSKVNLHTKILIILFFLGIIINVICRLCNCTNIEYIDYISMIVICVIMLYLVSVVFNQNDFYNDFNYIVIHLMYVFFPVVFTIQCFKNEINCKLFIYLSVLTGTSIISSIFMHKYLKNVNKKHLKYLLFWNSFFIVFLSIVITFIRFFDGNMNVILYLLFIIPLLILQLVFKRLELIDEKKEIPEPSNKDNLAENSSEKPKEVSS